MNPEYYHYSVRGGIALAMNKAQIAYDAGVYFLVNTERTRMYVGSTINSMYSRVQSHLSVLRHNKHTNKVLQRDWNSGVNFQYGILTRFPDPNPDNYDHVANWIDEGMIRCVERQWTEIMRWKYALYNVANSCACEICEQVAIQARAEHEARHAHR